MDTPRRAQRDSHGTNTMRFYYDANGEFSAPTAGAGARNPFRYRGYYYDTETSLYYLQSRYYDPEVGRFVNADGQINEGLLGGNLFAYCENNPVMSYDPDGTDAIWLQDKDNVFSFGHTGLLIEDRKGNWWHFYWGIEAKKGKTAEKQMFELYQGALTLKAINTLYTKDNKYDNGYEAMIRFRGDFTASQRYAACLNAVDYRFIGNNCMQKCIDVLLRGQFSFASGEYKAFLLKIRSVTIPNIAYSRLYKFNNAVVKWFNTPWVLRWMVMSPSTAVRYY